MKDKIQEIYEKNIVEGQKIVFAGLNLKDNILDEITVEELQDMVYSNIPTEKIDAKSVNKEFERLLTMKMRDAKSIVKKVIPELVKELQKGD